LYEEDLSRPRRAAQTTLVAVRPAVADGDRMIRFSLSWLLLCVAFVSLCCAILFAMSWQLLVVLDTLLVVLFVIRRCTARFYRLTAVDWGFIAFLYLLLHLVLWPSLGRS
jgi:hypothetical protein